MPQSEWLTANSTSLAQDVRWILQWYDKNMISIQIKYLCGNNKDLELTTVQSHKH